MNKTENMKKILSSCIVLSMVLTAFAGLLVVQTPTVSAEGPTSSEPLIRIYGEKESVYPTQSYYGENDFVYPEEYDPFDPGIIEKDSITFNPAFIDGHGGEYEIKAQGDASEKIFLRAFYEPQYTHPVDALMDANSAVTLHPVETFDALVIETTYHLVTLYDRDPTVGYPDATKVMLPYKSADPYIPGMEEAALLDVVGLNEENPGRQNQLTDGTIKVEKTYEFNNIDYSQDIPISFMDHKVVIKNYENGDDGSIDSLDLDVHYIGNMNEEISSMDTHTIWEDSWGPGFDYFFDRENAKQPFTDPAHRWYLTIENADEDYLRINVGRVLSAGETFYVDGVRYDMPAIYVDDNDGFKYITFQSPIPKGDTIWDMPLSENVDDFSHVTSQYLASLPEFTNMWLLPPFNDDHCMLDDIGLDKYGSGCLEVSLNGELLGQKEALEFHYVDETIEERFDSSLTERLYTDKGDNEYWQWYNIYTKPNQYTEFMLPDQETSMESDGNEYLITTSLIAPNSEVDTDRSNDCKAYNEHEIFDRVKEIALDNERAQYYEMPRFVYEYDANNPIDFYVNEGTNEPKLKIYGEPHFNYPTQSYTDADDFIYTEESDPFDPGVILKDSITFNPAFIDGHGGEYQIKAQGDASEKIFLRAFYEPMYGHNVDALMDANSAVTLHPVETFDALVTETTYHLVTIKTEESNRDPTVGYPDETKVVLPYSSQDPSVPGMEEQKLLDVVSTSNMGTRQLTDGSIAVETTVEFFDGSYIGEELRFMDHMVKIMNFEDSDYYTYDRLDLQVSYVGNMYDALDSPDTHTIWEDTWGSGFNYFFDRENKKQMNSDPAHRWYLRVENADQDYLRMSIGRVLSAGETFYVDGVRYDMPAIYVDGNDGFKYITFQSPIPKGDTIWDMPLSENVDDFSHVTSQYLASLPEFTNMWLLPPFNDDHWMIDDIDLHKHGSECLSVPLNGMLLQDEKESLDFYYVDETIEERFETSLTERLFTNENGVEDWQWYNVYTKPNQYTEFVLPNQELLNEQYVEGDFPDWYPSYVKADGNEYLVTSSLIAPNSELDTDRSNDCKAYYEHEIFSMIDNPSATMEDAQLAMIIDGSGSISSSDWTIMRNGIADAVRYNLPHDGSVQLSIIQFAGVDTEVEIGPVEVNEGNYETIASNIETISQNTGMTPLAAGIQLATQTLEPTSDSYTRQLINIVTDGEPNVGYPDGKTAAEENISIMISTLGMDETEDEIDAEGIGISQSSIEWLRDNIVWPQPGYDDWPPTGPGWVRPVSSYTEFSEAIGEKFGLLFYGPIHPRMVFEFDACDGTGFFINENNNGEDPTADAGGPYNGCVEGTITFDGSGSYDNDESGASIVQYDWKFFTGDSWHNDLGSNPTHAYMSEGTYTVTLRVTDDEGATDTDTATVSVTCGEQDPTADAGGPYNADVEQIVTFDGSGSYDNDESGASIVQYDWKFFTGDSWHNGLGPNPTHAYMSEGTYTVTLRVTDDEGATDTDTTTVTVGDIPTTATIEMEDVDIEFDETTGDGYLKAKDVDDDVGSCEVTLSWDPTVANVVNVDDSDFEVIYWYADEAAGTITVIASNNNIALTGNFNIGKIHFEQVGTNGDSCDLTIEDSEMLTDDPQPSSIAHGADNGRLRLLTDVIDSGDMNGDGNVNSGDVRYLALYLAGDPDYNPLHDDGDVNSDGNVNSGDVRYLALYLAGDPDYSPLYP